MQVVRQLDLSKLHLNCVIQEYPNGDSYVPPLHWSLADVSQCKSATQTVSIGDRIQGRPV